MVIVIWGVLLLAAALSAMANTKKGSKKLDQLGLGFVNVIFRKK